MKTEFQSPDRAAGFSFILPGIAFFDNRPAEEILSRYTAGRNTEYLRNGGSYGKI